VRVRYLIVVGLFVGALVWLWHSTWEAPVEAERSEPAPRVATTPARRAHIPQVPQARLVLPPREPTFDATAHHTADPCTAIGEPVVPSTFESITAAGVTVAWEPSESVHPYDAALRPTSLAYTVAGILEEAAQLTGTERRQTLTVIVDGTTTKFQERVHAPSFISGIYDGTAIHLGAMARADLGVAIQTLRHETMHAQMHGAVGCTPFWFNEGLAQYFAGTVPIKDFVAMARGEPFDLDTLREPSIFDMKAENAGRMYAVSLAMVLAIVHRRGEGGLREAVRTAQSAESLGAALDLWNRVMPNVEYGDVVETLVSKVFGTVPGAVSCCAHLRSPSEVSCRAPGSEPPRAEVCRKY
jgi:hypothetical protein